MESRGVATATRNRQMAAKYLQGGTTLRQLAAEHGISHERVRQILEAAHVSSRTVHKARKIVRDRQRRETQCQQRYGVGLGELNALLDLGRAMQIETGCVLADTPVKRYERDKRRATGAAWALTLTDYVNVWLDAGRLNITGSTDGPRYVLARLDQSQPWTFDNVVVEAEKTKQKYVTKRQRRRTSNLPKGVRRVGKRFAAVVRIGGRYKRFGPFLTSELAAAAYEDARSWGTGKGLPAERSNRPMMGLPKNFATSLPTRPNCQGAE